MSQQPLVSHTVHCVLNEKSQHYQNDNDTSNCLIKYEIEFVALLLHIAKIMNHSQASMLDVFMSNKWNMYGNILVVTQGIKFIPVWCTVAEDTVRPVQQLPSASTGTQGDATAQSDTSSSTVPVSGPSTAKDTPVPSTSTGSVSKRPREEQDRQVFIISLIILIKWI